MCSYWEDLEEVKEVRSYLKEQYKRKTMLLFIQRLR